MINKNIKIKNKKDLDKFIKKICLYKSIFYKFTRFNIDSKYDLKIIEKALNIKTRRKRIIFIYDKACLILNSQYEGIDVCHFKDNKCIVQQKLNNGTANGCCRVCRFQSCTGCKSSNVACKLFYCYEVKNKYKMLEFDDLDILKILSIRQRILLKSNYFSSREEILIDLYIGSLVIGGFRILYRIGKTCLFNMKK